MTSAVAAGPRLDDLPGPVVITAGLPAAATWPMLRYEKPLRVLAVASKGASIAAYQRICYHRWPQPWAKEKSSLLNLAAAMTKYLSWKTDGVTGPYRDGNGWRIVAIRLTTTSKAEVTISGVKVIVQ